MTYLHGLHDITIQAGKWVIFCFHFMANNSLTLIADKFWHRQFSSDTDSSVYWCHIYCHRYVIMYMAALKMGLLDISFGCLIITMHMCICLPVVALIFCVLPTLVYYLLYVHCIYYFSITISLHSFWFIEIVSKFHSVFWGVCNLFKKLKILLLS